MGVNLDLSAPKINVQYHWAWDQELIAVQENVIQLQEIAVLIKTNVKMVKVIVLLTPIVQLVLDVEQTIAILHLDCQMMLIVALQIHVMLSMVMEDVAHQTLSVEKVKGIVIRIVTAMMDLYVEQTIVVQIFPLDLIVALQ